MRALRTLPLASLLLLLSLPSSVSALCKWVDENGTVHFAERCPEGVDGTTPTLGPEPTEEERAAAERRSRELAEGRAASVQAQAPAHAESSAETADPLLRLADCERARRERQILNLRLPVYRTPESRLYYRDALHHYWYTGARRYLDDAQRALDREATERFLANECVGIEPQRPIHVFRFRQPPPLDELLDMLADLGQPWIPPDDEVCTYARLMQRDLAGSNTGIPSDGQRALDDAIRQRCR